jgi:acetoin utilization protein AcuC
LLNIVYSPHYLEYNFGARHPFSPDRWEALAELLRSMDLKANWVTPHPATDQDLRTVHELPYLEAVKAASVGFPGTNGSGFGLGTSDVPIFYGMYEAGLEICGGTLTAARLIQENSASKVLQLGGGLHHAMAARAAGFCIYNDVAMAIHSFREQGMRVAYVDIDVHHGDGVQAMFYDDPSVLTISLHESGRFLFPGTGSIHERGVGAGLGACINIPLFPESHDSAYVNAFEAIVPDALRAFRPDVLVVEAGADTHTTDPLAHLALSTHGFMHVVARLVELSNELTEGRLLATLGGGYNFDSTIRMWTILAYTLAAQPIPDQTPAVWRTEWEKRKDIRLKATIHDDASAAANHTANEQQLAIVRNANEQTVRDLTELIQKPT